MNLADLIRLHALHRPEKTAIEYAGRAINYAECWASVIAGAQVLKKAGLKSGDRLGLSMREHPAHLLMHYAAAACGVCIVPIDHRWTLTEKQAACKAFNVQLLVIDHGSESPRGVRAIEMHPVPEPLAAATLELPDCTRKPLLISLSSGTTGRPKGAVVTHLQMYERFVTQWVTLGFNATDRFALVTPLYFGAGRSFGMSFLAAGAVVIIAPPPLKPAELVEVISTSRATACFLVPTVMRRLLELPGKGAMLSGLRRLLISGEAFFEHEVAEFKSRLTENLIGYYASSEGGGISVLQPDDFESHGASVGQAAFRVELSIVNERDEEVAVNEHGRLRYRGPGVAVETLDENGRANVAERDGWFYPGDLASRDAEGYLTLRGRARDVIIRGGVNVYPAEIEMVLTSHPEISEAAVLGVADAGRGERIIAFISAPSGSEPGQLDTFMKEKLAPYKIPSEIRVLTSLPRANSGKLDKKALRELAEAAA